MDRLEREKEACGLRPGYYNPGVQRQGANGYATQADVEAGNRTRGWIGDGFQPYGPPAGPEEYADAPNPTLERVRELEETQSTTVNLILSLEKRLSVVSKSSPVNAAPPPSAPEVEYRSPLGARLDRHIADQRRINAMLETLRDLLDV